jgi:hypothetical protein
LQSCQLRAPAGHHGCRHEGEGGRGGCALTTEVEGAPLRVCCTTQWGGGAPDVVVPSPHVATPLAHLRPCSFPSLSPAFRASAQLLAKLASPAPLPRKFAQPVTYEASGALRSLASWPDQWYTLPAEGYALPADWSH